MTLKQLIKKYTNSPFINDLNSRSVMICTGLTTYIVHLGKHYGSGQLFFEVDSYLPTEDEPFDSITLWNHSIAELLYYLRLKDNLPKYLEAVA